MITKSIDYDIVSRNIRRIMKEKKLSQHKLEDMSGVGRNYLTNILNNRNSPRVSTIQEIAVALNVDVRDLFNPEES